MTHQPELGLFLWRICRETRDADIRHQPDATSLENRVDIVLRYFLEKWAYRKVPANVAGYPPLRCTGPW
jgi:hypothetical protein